MVTEQAAAEHTNLTFLQPSRKKLREGDVFTFRLLEGPYLFGRVIRAEIAERQPIPRANLVYVYDVQSAEPQVPPLSDLMPERLLIPPLFVNLQGWLRGYFKTLANHPLTASDVLPEHCFLNARKQYVNERGEVLAAKIEPCGNWSLSSHRGLDDKVSTALGLPLAPD